MWLKPDTEDANLSLAADPDEAGKLAMNEAAGLGIDGPVRMKFPEEIAIVKYQLDAAVWKNALLGAGQFFPFEAPVTFDETGEGWTGSVQLVVHA